MSTSSSSRGGTNHSTTPTTTKHQLVSPEGFLRPIEGLPEGVAKLVIYVGGDKEKLKAILGICERINSTKKCTDLGTLFRKVKGEPQNAKYLVFNYRKSMTFTYIVKGDIYNKGIQKGVYYEVSYDLFIEKLRWVERALLFQDYVEELGLD